METHVSRVKGSRSPLVLYSDSLKLLDEWRDPINARIAAQKEEILYSYQHPRCKLYHFEADSEKTIVFFHGGAWITNQKEDFCYLWEHGWNNHHLVLPDYVRLSDGKYMQATVDSAIAAVLWAKQNIGPDVVVAGHSAGGHLAAYVSTIMETSAVVGISGIYNLMQSSLFRNVKDKFPDQNFQPYCAGELPTLSKKVFLTRGDHEGHIHHHIKYLGERWSGTPLHIMLPYNTDHFTILQDMVRPGGKLQTRLEEFINENETY